MLSDNEFEGPLRVHTGFFLGDNFFQISHCHFKGLKKLLTIVVTHGFNDTTTVSVAHTSSSTFLVDWWVSSIYAG